MGPATKAGSFHVMRRRPLTKTKARAECDTLWQPFRAKSHLFAQQYHRLLRVGRLSKVRHIVCCARISLALRGEICLAAAAASTLSAWMIADKHPGGDKKSSICCLSCICLDNHRQASSQVIRSWYCSFVCRNPGRSYLRRSKEFRELGKVEAAKDECQLCHTQSGLIKTGSC